MATTGEILLSAILAEPADDFHRLAYADWLEECGHDAHAEFVRVQLRKAEIEKELRKEASLAGRPRGLYDEWDTLHDRAKYLLQHNDPYEWMSHFIPGFAVDTPGGFPYIGWNRGFPCLAKGKMADWMRWHGLLAAYCPLGRVEITDRQPVLADVLPSRAWRNDTGLESVTSLEAQRAALPVKVFDALKGGKLACLGYYRDYPTADAAYDALSTALLFVARKDWPGIVRATPAPGDAVVNDILDRFNATQQPGGGAFTLGNINLPPFVVPKEDD